MIKKIFMIFLLLFTISCKNLELNKKEDKIETKRVTELGFKVDYYSNKKDYLYLNNNIMRIEPGKNELYLVQEENTLDLKFKNSKKSYNIQREFNKIEYGVSHEEYLLLSLLSYAHFNESHIGKNLYELLKKEKNNLILDISIFSLINLKDNWELFLSSFNNIFSHWKILEVSDNTNKINQSGIWNDGFYSIAFGKEGVEGKKVVIAYRGSESYPIKEAIDDFIRTDFFIGLGSKPKQFEAGKRFYKKIIEKYGYKNVTITGHSLGGGIAQYVGISSQSISGDKEYIPRVVTFNAIGILIKGMVEVTDFINFEFFIEADKNITKNLKKHKFKIANVFRTELSKDVNYFLFKRNRKINSFIFWLNKRGIRTKLKIAIIDKVTDEEINYLVETYYNKNFLEEKLDYAFDYLKYFEENKVYKDKITNYIHSYDFTGNFFPHVGSTYVINASYKEKLNNLSVSFSKEILSQNLKLITFHQPDIFFPYLNKEKYGDKTQNNFSTKLNEEYIIYFINKIAQKDIASSYIKDSFKKNLWENNIIDYYKLKNELIESLEKEDNFYFIPIIDYLKNQELEEIAKLWKLSLLYKYNPLYNIFSI